MAVSAEFIDHILDTLSPLGPVVARRMMGGATLYLGDLTFGKISDDMLYLKVGANNIADFEDAGSGPLTYMRGGKETALKSHWQMPKDLIDDPDEMVAWARSAVDAAQAANKAKPKKKK